MLLLRLFPALWCFVLFASLAVPGIASPQSVDKRTTPIPRLISRPSIDGEIEPLWQKEAARFEEFYEIDPGRNLPAPVRTIAYVAYDQENFYFAFECFDPHPKSIRATLGDHDTGFGDDFVIVFLDTFHDNRRAYEFVVNPYGVQGDLIRVEGQGEDPTFDAIWSSAGRVNADGWTAEAAIPFKSLRFQNLENQSWGFVAFRNHPREVRRQILSKKLDYNDPCIICQLDTISGIQGVRPGRNLEIVPTLTGLYSDHPMEPRDRIRREVEAGLGFKYGLTPNVTLDFTANPDFSQVEADVDQLDVNTRFALFFPEKRPFFLEGQDYFKTSGPLNLFHSRSIVEPLLAGKLTGKAGAHQFGILSARDQSPAVVVADPEGSAVFDLQAKSMTHVIRYRHDLFTSSSVGGFVSDLRLEEGRSSLAAADFLLRPYRNITLTGLVAGSSADELGLRELQERKGTGTRRGTAYQLSANMGSRNYEVFSSYTDLSRDFRADLGFLRRTDVRQFEGGGSYTWYPESNAMVVRIGPALRYLHASNHEGEGVEGQVFAGLQGELKRQIRFMVGGSSDFERFGGVRFDDLSRFLFTVFAQPMELFTGRLNITLGDQVDFSNIRSGRGYNLDGGAFVKATDHLSFDLSTARQRLSRQDSAAEVFHAQTVRLKTIYQFNTRMFVRSIVQYRWVDRDPLQFTPPVNAQDRRLESFWLFAYKLNPQTVFFLGYNDTLVKPDDFAAGLERSNSALFVKLGYTFRP